MKIELQTPTITEITAAFTPIIEQIVEAFRPWVEAMVKLINDLAHALDLESPRGRRRARKAIALARHRQRVAARAEQTPPGSGRMRVYRKSRR